VFEIVDQHVRRLAGQRRLDPLAVPGGRTWLPSSASTASSSASLGVTSRQAAERVVLGLAHEVGGGEGGDGGVVGQDRDLGGPASESMPHRPCTSRLAAAT
jgi:hypothetical protein